MIHRLKGIRQQKGMTQRQLSEASGINRASIAKYETGKSVPSLNNAEKLAKALDVKIEELMSCKN